MDEEDQPPQDLNSLDAIHSLGLLYHEQERHAEAAKQYRRAMVGYERLLGPEAPKTLHATENLGNMLISLDELDEAMTMMERARRGYEIVFGSESEYVFRTWYFLGNIYGRRNQVELSMQLYERALAGFTKTIGPDGDMTLRAARMLALRLVRLERYVEAVQLLEPTLVKREELFGWENLDTVQFACDLGSAYLDVRRYPEAETLILRVVSARERLLGTGHEQTLHAAINLGNALYFQGKYQMAESHYQRVLVGREKLFGPGGLPTLAACYNVGLAQLSRKKPVEAEQMFQRTFDGRKAVLGPKDPLTLEAANQLAAAYHAQKRFDEAERILQQILGRNAQPETITNTSTAPVTATKREVTTSDKPDSKVDSRPNVIVVDANAVSSPQEKKGIKKWAKKILSSRSRPGKEETGGATTISQSKSYPAVTVQAVSNKTQKPAATATAATAAQQESPHPKRTPDSNKKTPEVNAVNHQVVTKQTKPAKKSKPRLSLPTEVARKLVDAGVDPTDPEILEQQYPFFWACEKGHVDVLEVFLGDSSGRWRTRSYLEFAWDQKKQPTEHTSAWDQKTPFQLTLDAGQLHAANLLLRYGAQARYSIRDGSRISALCGEDVGLAERVMRETYTLSPSEGTQAVRAAIDQGDLENARLLMKYGASLGYGDGDRESILRDYSHDAELLEIVLQNTYTAPGTEGVQRFRRAVGRSDFETAKFLLRYGANAGYSDRDKEKMVVECGDDVELMREVLQQTFPLSGGAMDYVNMNLRIWVLIFAIKQPNVNCVRLLWDDGGCGDFVSRFESVTTSDSLYFLYKNLCRLEEKGRSEVLDHLRNCRAVETIKAMWRRSEKDVIEDTELERITREQTAARRMKFLKEHEGMLDPAILNWD